LNHFSVPVKTKPLGTNGRLPVDSDAVSSDGDEFCDTSDVTSFNVIIIIIKNCLFAQAVSYRQYEDALTNKLYAKACCALTGIPLPKTQL
jgi:hypothetical protein